MPVYIVPVNGEKKMVKADSKAQAVRAATMPLVGKVDTLSPDEIAEHTLSGVPMIDAAKALAAAPIDQTEEPAASELPDANEEEKTDGE